MSQTPRLEIVTVPCLADNYAFLVHDAQSGATALVDVPEAAPILAALKTRGWRLDDVLLTHHHADHVQGLAEVLARHPARVTGAAADAHRLPALDRQVKEGDRFDLCGQECHVLDVSGHTVGHVAYHLPAARHAFTGDSLMALGCGRVFEGTFPQMHDSLQKLAALPPETIICSGHEYTAANAKFALSIDPGNSALISRADETDRLRAADTPTVPSDLALELATNPFLRGHDPDIARHLGMDGAPAAEVFAEIRRRKDRF